MRYQSDLYPFDRLEQKMLNPKAQLRKIKLGEMFKNKFLCAKKQGTTKNSQLCISSNRLVRII
jgi:hypothetical protein